MRTSIYIPTFNRARYLAAAVESALRQSRPPDEILVVDDGSEDGTADVLATFDPARVRVFRRSHEGIPRTRNFALRQATGDVVIALGSDDVLVPWAVEAHLRNFASDPRLDVSYGDHVITDERLMPSGRIRFREWRDRSMALLGQLALENALPDGGSAIRREALARAGGYDESFSRAQDYDLWTRMLPDARVGHCGETTLFYRWHDANTSTPRARYDVSHEARIRARLVDRFPPEELFPDTDFERLRRLSAACGVVLWGAGSLGRTILRILERAAVPVRHLADSDPTLTGTTIAGLNVTTPASMLEIDVRERPFVILASVKYRDMARLLEGHGWLAGRHFAPLAELTYA